MDGERAAFIKRRFLDLHRVMSIRDFLSGWFRGAPYEAVRRGNVEDFVAYGFYTRSMSQLPDKVRLDCLLFRDRCATFWRISIIRAVRKYLPTPLPWGLRVSCPIRHCLPACSASCVPIPLLCRRQIPYTMNRRA